MKLDLNLTHTDKQKLKEKAASVGLTVEALLELFTADLINGTRSNGEDQHQLANKWFDSCPFSYEKTAQGFAEDLRNGIKPVSFF